jgi:hypothetical protein
MMRAKREEKLVRGLRKKSRRNKSIIFDFEL